MIVGDGVFEISGTDEQVGILAACFDAQAAAYIAFPWRELKARPANMIPIGWADLNAASLHPAIAAELVVLEELGAGKIAPDEIPGHVHIEGENGNTGHGILRERDGAWFVAGVFWTNGRIQIDVRCEGQPELAREVLSAELGHTVDYFLPLTGEAKESLTLLLHDGGTDEHTWWERHDYGEEYYTLVGEAFMAAFTIAYSAVTPWQDAFAHKVEGKWAAGIRAIIGVPATWEVAPVEPNEPEPVEPTPDTPGTEPPSPEEPDWPVQPVPDDPPARGCVLGVAVAGIAGAVGVAVGWFFG